MVDLEHPSLTLNILISFAEFERETIAERTRDKIIASRRRGMWTGGRPILGFDVVEKKLIVNEPEAEQVRAIFQLYLDLGSLLAVVRELDQRGMANKTWTTKAGMLSVGAAFTKGSLRNTLTNVLYRGKIRAAEDLCEGQHEAIVGEEMWDAVQAQLQTKTPTRGPRRRSDALLSGLLRCGVCGAAMGHHFTSRGQKRYASYVCGTYQKRGAEACPGSRVPASRMEGFVMDRVRAIGRDPGVAAQVVAAAKRDLAQQRPTIQASLRAIERQRRALAKERASLLRSLGHGGTPSLVERLADVDAAMGEADQETLSLRQQLASIDGRALDANALHDALARFDPIWDELFPRERGRVLELLIEEVRFHAVREDVEITFRPDAPEALRAGLPGDAA